MRIRSNLLLSAEGSNSSKHAMVEPGYTQTRAWTVLAASIETASTGIIQEVRPRIPAMRSLLANASKESSDKDGELCSFNLPSLVHRPYYFLNCQRIESRPAITNGFISANM